MILGRIDGYSVTGICFVSSSKIIYSIIFVLLPIFITLIIGVFYFMKVLFELWIIRKDCAKIISKRTWAKLNSLAIKVFMTMMLTILFISIMCMCYIHELKKEKLWNESLRKYIL